jgi:hypothetical protein
VGIDFGKIVPTRYFGPESCHNMAALNGKLRFSKSGVCPGGAKAKHVPLIQDITSNPEKDVSCWSSKRITGILWNFA